MLSFFDLLLLLDRESGNPFFRHNTSSSDRYMLKTDTELKKDVFTFDYGQVDFKVFCIFYYPHFSDSLKKIADAMSLWTEFFSIIKGSVPEEKHLLLETYTGLTSSRISTFSEDERMQIFAGFLRYETLKYERNEWDLMDLNHHLFKQLSTNSLITFEKIYIDEVQDLNMAQISLLFTLASYKDSFVFGGDTAQVYIENICF